MILHNIFVDESGYTGRNLLDPAQPVLSMASLCCDEAKCAEIKQRIFAAIKDSELKYSSLSKSADGQKMIIKFLRELAASPAIVKVAMADKRYALVGKMVDLIVEPAMHMSGVDLYDRGGNIALTNVMFALLGTGSHDTLLNRFQTMIRTLEVSDFEEFGDELFRKQFDDEKMDSFIDYFRIGFQQVGPSILIDQSRTLDLAFTLAFTLVSLWRRDIPAGEGIKLIHDASSIMEYNKQIWDAAVDVGVPKQEIGYDTRTHVFPIGVTKTVAEDSKKSIGIQLADVTSGATAAMGRAIMKDEHNRTEYESEIIEIVNSDAIYKYLIWPSKDVTPEALGTVGPNAAPVDDFMDILTGIP